MLMMVTISCCCCGTTLQDARAGGHARLGGAGTRQGSAMLWLRLRGGAAESGGADEASSPHALTRKMEAVWRCADTLRQRQRAPMAAAQSSATTTHDSGEEEERTFNEQKDGAILVRVLQNTRFASEPPHPALDFALRCTIAQSTLPARGCDI